MRICVVTSPRTQAALVPMSNLVNVLSSLAERLFLITGNEGSTVFEQNENIEGYSIEYRHRSFPIARILAHISMQLRISYEMIKIRNRVGSFVFFMFDGLLLPVLTARLMKRKVILSLASSAQQYFENHNDSLSKTISHLDALCYSLSNTIIVYSPNMVQLWKLEKHKTKIQIAHEHFLDFDTFGTTENLSKRSNIIGYIGRFSHEKGTMNFIKAIPEVLKQKDDYDFFIGGDGELREEMMENLDNENLTSKVNLHGWISHETLPFHLNTLKLLVLPSHTEGLPNIMLEAMACGTPVLATPVGAIPDVIKDGTTGFIMEDNSPDCIARNVVRALSTPRLDDISNNALALVKKDYNFEAAVEQYRKCLIDLA